MSSQAAKARGNKTKKERKKNLSTHTRYFESFINSYSSRAMELILAAVVPRALAKQKTTRVLITHEILCPRAPALFRTTRMQPPHWWWWHDSPAASPAHTQQRSTYIYIYMRDEQVSSKHERLLSWHCQCQSRERSCAQPITVKSAIYQRLARNERHDNHLR